MNTLARLFFICIGIWSIVACSDGGGPAAIVETETETETETQSAPEHDHPVPTVSTTTLADLSTGVNRNGPFEAVFDQEMFAVSLDNDSFTLAETDDSSAVSGNVSFDFFGRTASFTPDSQLPRLTSYTATLNTGVSSLIGTALTADYSWTFTTADNVWGKGELIDNNAAGAYDPQIVVDNNGNAIAIWQQGNNIWANRFDGTSWVTAELIETGVGPALQPQIVIDNSGNALVIWSQADSSGIYSTWANRFDSTVDITITGTGWGNAELIEAEADATSQPQIAIDNSGNAIAIWEQYDSINASRYIWANRFNGSTSSWGSAEPVESHDPLVTSAVYRPKIAFDSSGDALAVWFQSEIGVSGYAIWVSRFDGTSWGAAELISDGSTWYSQIATDSNGNALVAWIQADQINGEWDLYANYFDSNTGWGGDELIETIAENVQIQQPPEIAFDNSGNAFVVWGHEGPSESIYVNRYDGTSSSWGTAEQIMSSDTERPYTPQIAFDNRGNATVMWSQSGQIWINRYIDTVWGAAEVADTNVLTMTTTSSLAAPQFAFDSSGKAFAVWVAGDTNIFASRFE